MTINPTLGKPYKTGDGRWCVAINCGTGPDGKRRRPIVTRKTRTAALDAAKDKADKLRAGVKIDGGKTTVDAWLDYWFDQILPLRGLRPNTLRSYRTRADHSIRPVIGPIQLGQLAAAHVRQVQARIAEQGLSVGTGRLAHTVLTKALDDAVREQMIIANPAKIVDSPGRSGVIRPVLTLDQATHLIRTCEALGNPMTYRWAAALLTGARQGELIGLTWDRVDFDRKLLDLSWALVNVGYAHGCQGDPCGRAPHHCPARRPNIPRGYKAIHLGGSLVLGETKTASRIVPLIPPMERALRDHLAEHSIGHHNLVWTNPTTGTAIHPRNDSANWHAALEAAGLPKMPLHSARHTAATIMQSMRVPESVRMAILGHNSQTEHRGYAHVDDRLAREALESYGTALGLAA